MISLDEYGQVTNCYDNALAVRDAVQKHGSIAFPFSLGNMTMYHISFVDLLVAIVESTEYSDGSNRGLQMNIDRKGSYAYPWGRPLGHYSSFEKWNVGKADGEALLPFFNTVITGANHFENA